MVITRTLVFLAATVLILASCGSQSSKARPVDAGADAGADANVDARLIDFFGYLARSDAAPALACMGCFQSQCGNELNACANSVNCREGLLCAVGQCSAWSGALSGSVSSGITSADFTCISTCFKGDLPAALLAAKSANCATTACRSSCDSVLPRDGGAEAVPDVDGSPSTGPDGNSLPDSTAMDTPSHEAALPGTVDAPIVTDAPNVTTVDGAVDAGF